MLAAIFPVTSATTADRVDTLSSQAKSAPRLPLKSPFLSFWLIRVGQQVYSGSLATAGGSNGCGLLFRIVARRLISFRVKGFTSLAECQACAYSGLLPKSSWRECDLALRPFAHRAICCREAARAGAGAV